MKRLMLWILSLTLLLVSANSANLVRLTVINKAEVGLALSLEGIGAIDGKYGTGCVGSDKVADYNLKRRGDCYVPTYYLNVPNGSREEPATQTFTILRNTYRLQAYYLETYDPVYGYRCGTPKATNLAVHHSTRLVFLKCKEIPLGRGEPATVKFNAGKAQKR